MGTVTSIRSRERACERCVQLEAVYRVVSPGSLPFAEFGLAVCSVCGPALVRRGWVEVEPAPADTDQ